MRDITKYDYITQQDYEVVAGPDWPSYTEFKQHTSVADFIYDEIDTMLCDVKPFDPPTFCVLPFYGWEYPAKSPCCLLPTNHDIDTIRQDMLAGDRPQACAKCWNLEDQGINSDRKIKNATLDYYFKTDLQTLYDQAKQGNHHVISYKVDTSTTCNATCVTCNGQHSSAWANLERKNKQKSFKSWQLKNKDVDPVIDYSTAQSIGFRGGEPLLSDTNFYILEQLIAHGNTDCFISFTTNGSVELTQRQQSLISKFPNMNFCFSIDGVGPVFEYLRYPLKWSQIESNIQYCRQHDIMLSVSYTLSNLNILYYDQTVEWFNQQGMTYLLNPVYNPEYFRASALPKSIKEKLLGKLADSNVKSLLTTHSEKDDDDFALFLSKIHQQDQWKGISMQNYLPEFAALIDQ